MEQHFTYGKKFKDMREFIQKNTLPALSCQLALWQAWRQGLIDLEAINLG